MATTFTKLKDGTWGLRGENLVEGAQVMVDKRDSSPVPKVVGKILWTENGLCIATIAASGGQAAPVTKPVKPKTSFASRGTRTGCRCGSVEEFSKASDCWTCRHDAE